MYLPARMVQYQRKTRESSFLDTSLVKFNETEDIIQKILQDKESPHE